MDNCIFCQIVAGKIPCHKIYEDENFLAFLDIFPISTGHTLVIPKKHYRWVWDVPNIGQYMEVCQKIAKHFQIATKEEMVMSLIIGNEVPHPHIHLVPTDDKNAFNRIIADFTKWKKPKLQEKEALKLLERLKLE